MQRNTGPTLGSSESRRSIQVYVSESTIKKQQSTYTAATAAATLMRIVRADQLNRPTGI